MKRQSQFRKSKSERGASLIALLAFMAIIAVFLLAAAPSVQQQVQREKEREAIRRGEEIAEAIRLFVQYSPGNQLPKSMEELLEGVDIQGRTKKLQILRHSASIDPLSSTGEWKLVQSNDEALIAFQRGVVKYSDGATPGSPSFPVFQAAVGQITNSIDTETSEEEEPPGGEDDADTGDVPFVGVVSRSQRKSILAFYGIERHDRWIFTPLFRGGTGGNNSNGGGQGGDGGNVRMN